MTYAIVTGASRGLGAAVGKLLLERGINVIGVSRKANPELLSIAESKNCTFQHESCDLSDMQDLEQTFGRITQFLKHQNPEAVYLVNNAGVVEPIGHVMQVNNEELQNHVMVNSVAPMALMNMSLKYATDEGILFTGATITSGAAERPVYGWSAYCSTKAGINMYTQTAALEQNQLGTGHKLFAFSPGIMDTDMQGEIRKTSEEAFVDRDTFRAYKEKGMLRRPDEVAAVLVGILTNQEHIENGKIYNVSEYI